MGLTLMSFSAVALEVCMIILIVALVGGVVAWRIVKRVRSKKNGKPSCGCGCSDCASCGSCPSSRKKSSDTEDDLPEISVQSKVKCDFSDIVKK